MSYVRLFSDNSADASIENVVCLGTFSDTFLKQQINCAEAFFQQQAPPNFETFGRMLFRQRTAVI